MPVVYVVQEVTNRNILGAGSYGTLEILIPPNRQIMFSPQPVIRHLRDKLRNFKDEDYILAMGDPAAIGVVCSIAADVNNGRFKMLKWDRENAAYYAVEIDIFPWRTKEPGADG